MAYVSGTLSFQGQPINGATAKLWSSGAAFLTNPPQYNTALPLTGAPLQTTTTGLSHGHDGAYRFAGVAAGTYFVSIEFNGVIVYDTHDITSATAQFANVKTFGAVGDGLTNDTAAIQAAINDTTFGLIYFPPGIYNCGNLTINRSRIILEGQGATISWTGTGTPASRIYVGIQLLVSVQDVEIRHLRFQGDGVAANGHGGVYWLNAVTVDNLHVHHCSFASVVNGISGLRTASGVWGPVKIADNEFNIGIGTGTGQGDFIYLENNLASAREVRIEGNRFKDATSHDVRLVKLYGATVVGNQSETHRASTATLAVNAALSFSGCRQLTVESNQVFSSHDGSIEVTLAAGETCRNVSVLGNVIDSPGNNVEDIVIGATNPATVGTPSLIEIQSNQVYKSGRDVACVRVNSGLRVSVKDNAFTLDALTTAVGAIWLRGDGETAGTADYTDEVEVLDNQIYGTLAGGSLTGVKLEQLGAALFCGSSAVARFIGNRTRGGNDFLVGAAVANDNLYLADQTRTGLTFDASSSLAALAEGPPAGVWWNERLITSADSPYTPSQTDYVIQTDTSAGPITIALPATTGTRRQAYRIWKKDPRNALTLDPSGAELVDGRATLVLPEGFRGSVEIQSTGTAWNLTAVGPDAAYQPYKEVAFADSPYTLSYFEHNIAIDSTGGAITLVPPALATLQVGFVYRLLKYNAAANATTFDPPGAETVEGGATLVLAGGAKRYAEIINTGTTWRVVATEAVFP